MAENKFISELPKATELKNEAQFVIEQDGQNKSVKGEQITEFVRNKINYDEVLAEFELSGLNIVPDSQKTSEYIFNNYITGSVLIVLETSIKEEVYASGSIMNLSKESMFLLKKGNSYTIKVPYTTISTGCVLYNSDLDVIEGYSIRRGNAENIDGFITFDIDRVNSNDDAYLRISTKTIDIPKWSVEPKYSDFVNKKPESQIGTSESSVYENSLVGNSAVTKPCALVEGVVGENGAIYSVDLPDIFRVAFDFTIKEDANVDAEDISLIKTLDRNIVSVLRSKPELNFKQYYDAPATYLQVPKFTSGFGIGDFSITREALIYKPLIGAPILSLWLKGDFSETKQTEAALRERASWLQQYQDYGVVIDGDTFSIIRDGIGVDGQPFNGGATSTIFTTSLKEGDVWKSLSSLLSEIQNVENFEVKILYVSDSYTCEDISQVGKTKLVGYYEQKVADIGEGGVTEFLCDSFPMFINLKKDESIHTCEIIRGSDGLVYASVDGNASVVTLPEYQIMIGGNGVQLSNLLINIGNIGDVDMPTTIILRSKRSPLCVGLMGHGVVETYVNSTDVPNDGMAASTSRIVEICEIIKNNDIQAVNYSSLLKNIDSKTSCIFIYDDIRYNDLFFNKSIYNTLRRYGVPMNFATNFSRMNSEDISAIPILNIEGWESCSHSISHEVPMPKLNSIRLKEEFSQGISKCEEMSFNSNIFVYNWNGNWENMFSIMSMMGIRYAFNSGLYYSTPSCNPLLLGRINIADTTTDISLIKRYLEY